jgi:hypothetical protein
MRKSTKWLLFGGTAGTLAALAAAYGTAARAWHLCWGATRAELTHPMPFDELIECPNYVATRAITIDAPPEVVWPLLRDTRALPEGTLIRRAEENQWIAFAPPETEAEATWVVTLASLGDGRTRLVSRSRARFRKQLSSIVRYLVVDPAQFVIERKWLLGIQARASQNQMQVSELVP